MRPETTIKPALLAGDELTPLCLACLSPVELAHYFEALEQGRYLELERVGEAGGVAATLRSVLCRACAATPGLTVPPEVLGRRMNGVAD